MATTEQIQAAKRLLMSSEIDSIRLVEASAVLYPLGEEKTAKRVRKPAKISVFVPAPSARGDLLPGNRMRVLVKNMVRCGRGPAKDSPTILRIECTFQLVYSLPESVKPNANEIRAFCNTNALLNSWPYWREFVQNTIARMNLPPLTLPLFRLAPSQGKPSNRK